jgi:hypothetical protein
MADKRHPWTARVRAKTNVGRPDFCINYGSSFSLTRHSSDFLWHPARRTAAAPSRLFAITTVVEV